LTSQVRKVFETLIRDAVSHSRLAVKLESHSIKVSFGIGSCNGYLIESNEAAFQAG